ncbi:hypothetical protein EB169_02135, partial [archaeon]|nr:hypothetical protein [archaeon]
MKISNILNPDYTVQINALGALRILESIKPDGKGVIARTVAEGQSHKTLKADFNLLSKIWKDVQKKLSSVKAPSLA